MLLQCDHVNIPGLKVYAFESPPSSSYVVRLKTRGVPKTGAQAVMALLLHGDIGAEDRVYSLPGVFFFVALGQTT